MYFSDCVYGNIWLKSNQSISAGNEVITGKVADVFTGSDDTNMMIMDKGVELFVIYAIGAGTYASVKGKYHGKVEHIENCIKVGSEEINVRNAIFIGIAG